jgi:hypothetical protein
MVQKPKLGWETRYGQRFRCYDNGGRTLDRFTVVFDRYSISEHTQCSRFMDSLSMNARPFHPQGFCQHGQAVLGRHLGQRVPFDRLPADCQKAILADCAAQENDTKETRGAS